MSSREDSSRVTTASSPSRGRIPAWTAPVLVAIVAFGVFASTLGNGFTFDDTWLILNNERIDDPSYIRYMLFEREHIWRPVKRVSLMADHAIWGPERPGGFHLTNVLLHVGACLLLYAFALRLGLARSGALAGSLLFAVHPIHVEAVANISHRKEMLAVVFCLAAFLAWLEARSEGRPRAPIMGVFGRFLPAGRRIPFARAELVTWTAVAYLLAMLSKEVAAVMLPVVIAAREVLVAPSLRAVAQSLRPMAGRLVAFGVLVAGVLALFTFRGHLGSIPRRFGTEMVDRITQGDAASYAVVPLISLKAFASYAALLVWPAPLYVDRAFEVPSSIFDAGVLAGVGVFAAVIALAWATRRRSVVACFGLTWYLLNLFPVSHLVPLTFWLVAERFIYLPSIGLALALGALFELAWRGRIARLPPSQGRWALGILVVVVVVHSMLTVSQNRVWANDGTLWQHTLDVRPESSMAHYGVATFLANDERYEEAEPHFWRAIELNPRYVDPHYGLALMMLVQGRHDEAIAEGRIHAARDTSSPESLIVVGNALVHLGRPDEAVDAYAEATERDAEYAGLRFNHANALRGAGRFVEALERLGDPRPTDKINDHFLRGVILHSLGRPHDALASFYSAAAIDPNHAQVQQMISTVEQTLP